MPDYSRQVPAEKLSPGLRGLWDRLVEFYNKNENDIDAILDYPGPSPGAAAKLAFLPLIAARGARGVEYAKLFKKVTGFNPIGKINVKRWQPINQPKLAAHYSRGSIFALPAEIEGVPPRVFNDNTRYLIPPHVRNLRDYHYKKATVNVENPAYIFPRPADFDRGYYGKLLLKINKLAEDAKTRRRLEAPLYEVPSIADDILVGLKRQDYSKKQINELEDIIRAAIVNRESVHPSEFTNLVLKDLLLGKLMKKQGFDAIYHIFSSPISHDIGRFPRITEISLMPDERVGEYIYRSGVK